MPAVDLLFNRPPVATPGVVNLVFNEDLVLVAEATLSVTLGPPTLNAFGIRPNDATFSVTLGLPTFKATGSFVPFIIYEGTVGAVLPVPSVSAYAGKPNDASASATLPAPTLASTGKFDSNTERPTVGQVTHDHQQAAPLPVGTAPTSGKGQPTKSGVETHHEPATPLRSGVSHAHQVGVATPRATGTGHQTAIGVATDARTAHRTMLRTPRPAVGTRHQEGVTTQAGVQHRHQDMLRNARPFAKTRAQVAVPLFRAYTQSAGKGAPFVLRRGHRHQEAMVPPPGTSNLTGPVVPPFNPCYTPDPNLLFADAFGATPNLVFICDNHVEPPPEGQVVVPVRSVYIVLNDVYLKRVSGNLNLPATDFSLSIDVDSWTWSFNANLPYSSLGDVEPVAGVPTELEASINGSQYRVLVEQISTERSFNSRSIRVSGRGKSALLAAPYAPTVSFSNSAARTAQQLMADALTVNGVPLPWSVVFGLTDWLVPAGVFGMQGSYMDAITAIAQAAGGYVQPHPTLQQLRILPKYPTAPWLWGTVTPDFVLPADLAVREGIEWRDRPDYDRVFVSGQQAGVLGQVTRQGFAGELLAPMVTDALITHADAARQRGLAVLGDSGRKAIVNLGLPVLPVTGVITPGKFVRYTEGAAARLGLVRATNVSVGRGGATVNQSITLECNA